MSFFADYLKKTDDRLLTKWAHYFEVYDRELARLRNRDLTFLEIGIYKGGSVPMWKNYFSPGSKLVFIDIDPACRDLITEDVHVEIGDQADPKFLAMLVEKYGPFDVIIDDGGHHVQQQRISLEHLWPHLKDRGLYLVEDTHTSYWPGFGGGYRAETSFIEHSKTLIDAMHSWYTDQDDIFPLDDRARELGSLRFYDSIVVLEKRLKAEPPMVIGAQNGQIRGSRRSLEIRGRRSIFQGRDGMPAQV